MDPAQERSAVATGVDFGSDLEISLGVSSGVGIYLGSDLVRGMDVSSI